MFIINTTFKFSLLFQSSCPLVLCPEPTPGSGRSLARLSEEEDQHKMVASTTVFVVEPGSSPVGETITEILDKVDDNLEAAGKVEQ